MAVKLHFADSQTSLTLLKDCSFTGITHISGKIAVSSALLIFRKNFEKLLTAKEGQIYPPNRALDQI